MKQTITRFVLRIAVAAVALLAVGTALPQDQASATDEDDRVVCADDGFWHLRGMDGFAKPKPKIPCDHPKPKWGYDLSTPEHDLRWVYDGDDVMVPVCEEYRNGSWTRTGLGCPEEASNDGESGPTRSVLVQGTSADQGRPGPLVDQPLAHDTEIEGFTYTADENNRAVRGADGNCYRESRHSGRWVRSTSYGSDEEACRQASWQAYNFSQDGRLITGEDDTPDGLPEGDVLRTPAVTQPEVYVTVPAVTITSTVWESRWQTADGNPCDRTIRRDCVRVQEPVLDDEGNEVTETITSEPYTSRRCTIYDQWGYQRGTVYGGSTPCPGGSRVDNSLGRLD